MAVYQGKTSVKVAQEKRGDVLRENLKRRKLQQKEREKNERTDADDRKH
ncbi:MAG TPA: hypothetical protein VIF12_05395 [Micavibrio sp.]|jgi:hypothetical protein